MLGHTHFSIAAVTTGFFMLARGIGPEALPIMAAAGLGALAPDVDEPSSTAGRKLPLLSRATKAVFGHRGLTHTVFGAAGFVTLVLSVELGLWGSTALPYCLAAAWGYLTHLYLGDLFTFSGIPLFSRARTYGLPRNKFRRIKVGSPGETTLFLGLLLLAGAEVALITGLVSLPRINLSLPSIPIPAWPHFLPPWAVLALLPAAIALVLMIWSRWHWRIKYSESSVTYRITFNHRSEDLPLRSEQLGNLLHNLRIKTHRRIFLGQPHLTLTFASCEGEKRLYVTVPDMWHNPRKVQDALLDKLRGSRLEASDFRVGAAKAKRRYGRLKPVRPNAFL